MMEDLFASEGTDVTSIGFTPTGEAITVLYNDIDTKPQRHYLNKEWEQTIEGLKAAFDVDYVGIASMIEYAEKIIITIEWN